MPACLDRPMRLPILAACCALLFAAPRRSRQAARRKPPPAHRPHPGLRHGVGAHRRPAGRRARRGLRRRLRPRCCRALRSRAVQRAAAERYKQRLLVQLKAFPDQRAGIEDVSRRFSAMLAPALTSFEARFGPMTGYPPIYLVHSLGEFDGGTRDPPGGSRLPFGADMIARITTGAMRSSPSSTTSCSTSCTLAASMSASRSGAASGLRGWRSMSPPSSTPAPRTRNCC